MRWDEMVFPTQPFPQEDHSTEDNIPAFLYSRGILVSRLCSSCLFNNAIKNIGDLHVTAMVFNQYW